MYLHQRSQQPQWCYQSPPILPNLASFSPLPPSPTSLAPLMFRPPLTPRLRHSYGLNNAIIRSWQQIQKMDSFGNRRVVPLPSWSILIRRNASRHHPRFTGIGHFRLLLFDRGNVEGGRWYLWVVPREIRWAGLFSLVYQPLLSWSISFVNQPLSRSGRRGVRGSGTACLLLFDSGNVEGGTWYRWSYAARNSRDCFSWFIWYCIYLFVNYILIILLTRNNIHDVMGK